MGKLQTIHKIGRNKFVSVSLVRPKPPFTFMSNTETEHKLVMIPSAGTVADTRTTFQKENLLVTDNLSLVP